MMTMNNIYVELEFDPSGDLILPIPDEIIELLGWKERDVLEFEILDDQSFIIRKCDDDMPMC